MATAAAGSPAVPSEQVGEEVTEPPGDDVDDGREQELHEKLVHEAAVAGVQEKEMVNLLYSRMEPQHGEGGPAGAAEVQAPLGPSVFAKFGGSPQAVVGTPTVASTALSATAMSIAYESSGLSMRWADVVRGNPRIADVPTVHGKSRHRQRGHKPFTPLQRKAVKANLPAGDRNIIGEEFDTGEVLQVAKSYAWVRPCGPLPLEVERVLDRAVRDFEDEPKIYVALADIAEVGLVLAVATMVLFMPYISPKGVGGCEVISA